MKCPFTDKSAKSCIHRDKKKNCTGFCARLEIYIKDFKPQFEEISIFR